MKEYDAIIIGSGCGMNIHPTISELILRTLSNLEET
jgi:hypothetical protein